MNITHPGYQWKDSMPGCSHAYLLPGVINQIQLLSGAGNHLKIVDVGCGNGYVSSALAELGHSVMAFDCSPEGIAIAQKCHPAVRFMVASIYDEKLRDAVNEPVDVCLALEVVEHLFFPKRLFEKSYLLLKEGGHLIISTPYHGYMKNLAISLANGWDRHFTVDWDGGHIKFFSRKTLVEMACDAGYKKPRFNGVGRIPLLWKSMIMVFEK